MNRRQLLKKLLQASAVTGAGVIGASLLPGCQNNRKVSPLFSLDLLDPKLPLPEHLLTPLSEFYVQSYALPSRVDVEKWRLEIKGAVARSLSLTFEEILAQPQEDFYLTMECIGNPAGGNLIGNARWTGTPLLPFLEKAGVKPEAKQFALHGADWYETTLPIAEVMRPEVRLIHRMNGEPLTQAHGYPLRILIPGHFGQKQPKWLTAIEAITTEKRGFWERQGWSNTATIPTHSLIRQIQSTRIWNRHHQASFLPSGETGWTQGILVAGVALDGAAAVKRVFVSTDGGKTWEQAEQNHPQSPHEWTLWRYLWQPSQPGTYTLLARTESARSPHSNFGASQQPLDDANSKDGSSGVLRVQVKLQA